MSERTGVSKRGAKATQFPFSSAQDRAITQWCEYLKDNITTIAGSAYIKKNSQLTKWKVEKSKELMDLEEFHDLDTSTNNTDAWRKAIVTRFTNYYHSHIRPIHTSASGGAIEDARTGPKHDKLSRSFALLSTDLSGRDFFARENEQLLQERTDDIYEARGHAIPKGAARNIALAELWDEFTSEEKNHWKERAEIHAMDIPSNRKEFPLTIGAALRDLCKRGRIGTVVMSLNIAYRSEDNGLDSHCINIGFNAETGKKISHNMDTTPDWSDMWRAHAESILPEVAQKKPSAISLSDDGVPHFPALDLGASSPAFVASVVEEYITKLWAKASPADQGRSDVLWEHINDDASFFYDTEVFKLPTKLVPAFHCTNFTDLYKLVDYFYELQRQGTPFKFTRRSELSSDSEEEIPPPRPSFKKKRHQVVSDNEQSSDEDEVAPSNPNHKDKIPSPRLSVKKKRHQVVPVDISGSEQSGDKEDEAPSNTGRLESPLHTATNPQKQTVDSEENDTADKTPAQLTEDLSKNPSTSRLLDISAQPLVKNDNNHASESTPGLLDARKPSDSDSGLGDVPVMGGPGQPEATSPVNQEPGPAVSVVPLPAKKTRGRPLKKTTTQPPGSAIDSDPSLKRRTLRTRGPAGAVITPVVPLKRVADASEDVQAVKKKKGWKGWALEVVYEDNVGAAQVDPPVQV